MRNFEIGKNVISFTDDYVLYGSIRRRLGIEAKKAVEQFTISYKEYGDITKVVELSAKEGHNLILNSFLSFKDLALKNEMYDFGKSTFMEHFGYNSVLNPFNQAINIVAEELNKINFKETSKKEYRKNRKESRARIVGGGFGLSGAAKGIATAGAINIGTGILHGSVNAVQNVFTSLSAIVDRNTLYDKALPVLSNALRESILNMVPLVCDVFGIHSIVDRKKEENILKNILDGSFGKHDLKKPFADALVAYPFDENLYKVYLSIYPEEQEYMVNMADYFGVDLNDFLINKCTLHGFRFLTIAEAEYAKALEQDFINNILKMTNAEFENLIFDEKTLALHSNKWLVNVLKSYYSSDIKVENKYSKINIYRQFMRDFYNKILNDNVGLDWTFKFPYAAVGESLELKLGVYSLFFTTIDKLKEDTEFGKCIDKIKQIKKGKRINWNENIETYFSYKSFDTILVVSNKGILTHALDKWISFDEINEFSYEKDLMGSTLLVNGKNVGSYVNIGHDMQFVVRMLNDILPELKIVYDRYKEITNEISEDPKKFMPVAENIGEEDNHNFVDSEQNNIIDNFKNSKTDISDINDKIDSSLKKMSRKKYFIFILSIFIVTELLNNLLDGEYEVIIHLLSMLIYSFFIYKRLEALGKSKYLTIIAFIPVVNIAFLIYLCIKKSIYDE